MSEPLVRRSPRFARHRWIARRLRGLLPKRGKVSEASEEEYRRARAAALAAFYARGKDE